MVPEASLRKVWQQSLKEAEEALAIFSNNSQTLDLCESFSRYLIDCYNRSGTVFSCGNGGSHCDAMHFAEEMTGRYRKDRRPLGALALGDASHVTCVSNDYGFEFIFSRQLEALARPGDVIIGLSTSGNSKNLLRAFEVAKTKGVRTIGLLGKGGALSRSFVTSRLLCRALPPTGSKNCTSSSCTL